MKTSIFARMMSLAAVGLLIAQPAWAADGRSEPRRLAEDVVLLPGGVLNGRVADDKGQGKAGVEVTLMQQGKTVAKAVTGDDGRFTVSGVRAGVYQIRSGAGSGVYRLWAPRTAPPAAQSDVRLSVASEAVRGQAPASDVVRGQSLLEDYSGAIMIGGAVGAGALGYYLFDHNPHGS